MASKLSILSMSIAPSLTGVDRVKAILADADASADFTRRAEAAQSASEGGGLAQWSDFMGQWVDAALWHDWATMERSTNSDPSDATKAINAALDRADPSHGPMALAAMSRLGKLAATAQGAKVSRFSPMKKDGDKAITVEDALNELQKHAKSKDRVTRERANMALRCVGANDDTAQLAVTQLLGRMDSRQNRMRNAIALPIISDILADLPDHKRGSAWETVCNAVRAARHKTVTADADATRELMRQVARTEVDRIAGVTKPAEKPAAKVAVACVKAIGAALDKLAELPGVLNHGIDAEMAERIFDLLARGELGKRIGPAKRGDVRMEVNADGDAFVTVTTKPAAKGNGAVKDAGAGKVAKPQPTTNKDKAAKLAAKTAGPAKAPTPAPVVEVEVPADTTIGE